MSESNNRDQPDWFQRTVDAEEAVRDLLDAIKGLIDFIEIDGLPMNGDALQIARAAIAKAEVSRT